MIEELCGPTSPEGDRGAEVINAQAAALAWVRDVTGTYPAPKVVAERLQEVADRLRNVSDGRDPVIALGQAAIDAVAAYRASPAPSA